MEENSSPNNYKHFDKLGRQAAQVFGSQHSDAGFHFFSNQIIYQVMPHNFSNQSHTQIYVWRFQDTRFLNNL